MLRFGIIFVAVATIAAGCVSTPSTSPTGSTTPVSSGAASVSMKNIQFSPPTLAVATGTTVTWTNHDEVSHTVTPDDVGQWGTTGSGDASTSWIKQEGAWSFTFTTPGTYTYRCIPHSYKGSDGKWAGMAGSIVVGTGGSAPSTPPASGGPVPNVSISPSPVAPTLTKPGADGIVRLSLKIEEVSAKVADGVGYAFWTFNGTVPGPMLRVTEGDVVNLTLTNPATSLHTHSIDLHAVTGPGGGAKVMQVAPGETRSFQFKAIHPGDYVYHCATPPVPDHIANGMYGMIVVEPKGGLPKVDREFYVMQGELYTQEPLGTKGMLSFDPQKVIDETPTYVTFNGAANALTGAGALTSKVNDTVRIFFGVGGAIPSSFHVIGEIFDRVMMDGNPPTFENRQTVLIPAAGAATFEFTTEYPGTYILVDHTLARTFDRGALGMLMVTGPADPSVFSGTPTAGSGH